jgi:hypothetical protein
MTVQLVFGARAPAGPVTQVPPREKTPAVPLNVSEFSCRGAVAPARLLIVTTSLAVVPRRALRVSEEGVRENAGVGTKPTAEKVSVLDT